MSYSFGVTARDKAAAKAQAAAELDKVVTQQPCHAADRPVVEAAIAGLIDTLGDNPDRDVSVSANGSVSGTWHQDNTVTDVQFSSFSCTVRTLARA